MRWTMGLVGVAMLTTLTACTGGTSDDSGGKSDDSDTVKTEPVDFDSKPVWTTGAGPDDDQPKDRRSGLEQVNDIQLVGDHVVLAGWDEDGDLNDQFEDHNQNRAAIAILNAETGERVWWISQKDPLPEDESMIVTGLSILRSSEAYVTESGSVVVGYEKEDKAADEVEFGVVALAVDSGKLVSSVAAAGTAAGLSIDGVVGDDVLVEVDDSDDSGDDRIRAMVLNVATGETVWSRDDMRAADITEDALLLSTPAEEDEDRSYHVVDRDSDKTLWKSDELREDEFGVYSFTSDVTVANTDDAIVLIATATGKELDVIESDQVGGCLNSPSLIACTVSQGLVSISVDGKSTRFSKVRPFLGVTAVSNWIFTMQEGKKDGTYVALDAAGNQVDTPGMVADLDDELAITFTTESGGLNPAVTEISAYTID